MRDEIAASDEDDGMGSDSSGESIPSIPTFSSRITRDDRANHPHTPKAKRAAIKLDKSPLPILPKYNFDLASLAEDARKDSATQESSARLQTQRDRFKESAGVSRASTPASVISNTIIEQGSANAQNVIRAVQRVDKGDLLPQYCFFTQDPEPNSSKFPSEAADAPWRLLIKDSVKVREQNILSGLPMAFVRKEKRMPDSVLRWILRDLCTQKSTIIRQEYCQMIACCHDQVRDLINPDQVLEIFTLLGADESLKTTASLPLRHVEEPYKDRSWACLRSVLQLLELLADQLCTPTVIYAIQVLFRMGFDRFLTCNMELLPQFEHAVERLTAAIPTLRWDDFCSEMTLLLHTLAKEKSLQINVLLSISTSSWRTHELRRRLALSCLFKKPENIFKPPNVILEKAIERLDEPDFVVRADTDFLDLRAGVAMLDIAIDDGSTATFENANDEKQFNMLVDQLAYQLQKIWASINDSGLKLARTEAKSVVEWVQQRLQYSVRTHKKMKESIFDLLAQGDDKRQPKQQDIRNFYFKPKAKTPLNDRDATETKT